MARFRSVTIILGAGLAFALGACGNGPPGTGASAGSSSPAGNSAFGGTSLGTAAVKIDATGDQKFAPAASSVKAGAIVQWSIVGNLPHNISFDGMPDQTSPPALSPGDVWQAKFPKAGTFTYHCTIHPGMDGTLTVTAG